MASNITRVIKPDLLREKLECWIRSHATKHKTNNWPEGLIPVEDLPNLIEMFQIMDRSINKREENKE